MPAAASRGTNQCVRSRHPGRVSQCVFFRHRDHQRRPYLQPEPLKAAADKYLRTPLRLCNLPQHVDRVMSRVAPRGAADQYQARQQQGSRWTLSPLQSDLLQALTDFPLWVKNYFILKKKKKKSESLNIPLTELASSHRALKLAAPAALPSTHKCFPVLTAFTQVVISPPENVTFHHKGFWGTVISQLTSDWACGGS